MTEAPVVRELRRAPSAKWFMLRAVWPRPPVLAMPALTLQRARVRLPRDELEAYSRLTGRAARDSVPMEWPQVWSFRLQMALLTDRRFPLPIWSALQVRNHLRQLRPLSLGGRYTICVQPQGLRRLDKGAEVDLQTRVLDERGELAWESTTTFYWRGRGRLAGAAAPGDAASPAVQGEVRAQWSSGEGGGWRFGALTGDYNGLHWNDRYARAFGFARAFHHPPRIVGQCLAHLQHDDEAPQQELALWIKGPVYYRGALQLRAVREGDARLFALHVEGEPRPALVGRWSAPVSASITQPAVRAMQRSPPA